MQQPNKVPEGNIHPDQSVLPKDSDFYQPEDTRTTREKLKSMKFTDKVVFIAQYYGLKIVVVIAAIAFVVYLILHFALAKETALSIMAVNAQNLTTSEAAADEKAFYDDFLHENQIDPQDVNISISSNTNVSADQSDSASMQSLQAIQVQLMAGTDDVMFGDEEFVTSLGEMGYLVDVSTILSEEALDKYADDIVYATSVDSKETAPVGIRLKDNAWIAKSGWYANGTEPVIGVCAGGEHQDLAIKFMRYVLGEES